MQVHRGAQGEGEIAQRSRDWPGPCAWAMRLQGRCTWMCKCRGRQDAVSGGAW